MNFAISFSQSDLLHWGISAAIVAGFIGLAFLSRLILLGIVSMLARHTKTTLDDMIVQALTAPVFAAIVAGGLWIALARLTELDPYDTVMHQGFTIVYISIAAVALVRVIRAFLTWYTEEVVAHTKTHLDERIVPTLRRVVDIIVYAIALMIILDQLHVNISPILAGLGIGGLAIALALQSTLSNFLAGTYVITDSVIRKGHYIMLDSGQEGTVEDIGWRTTKIRHWQGNLIVLPNSKLADAIVTNFDRPDAAMLFTLDCGVAYGSDLETVERVTLEVARKLLSENPSGVKDFEPVVRFNKFADSNIAFSVVLKGKDRVSQFLLKHEFIKALQKRYQAEGITIEFPMRKVVFTGEPPAGRSLS